MNYCRDEIASDDDRGKCNLLAIKTLKEYDDLDRDDELKALVFRKSAEDGEYLGDPRTERSLRQSTKSVVPAIDTCASSS